MNLKRFENAKRLIQGLWESELSFPGDKSRLLGEMGVVEEELLKEGEEDGELTGRDRAELLRTKTKLEGVVEPYQGQSKADRRHLRNALSDFQREMSIALKKLKGIDIDEETIESVRKSRREREEEEEEEKGLVMMPPGIGEGGELP